jgi:hypothetical protein
MAHATSGRSELPAVQATGYDECGCGEGYEWWLRHQGLLTSKSALEGERDYPPPGEWYAHIEEYHAWMEDGRCGPTTETN